MPSTLKRHLEGGGRPTLATLKSGLGEQIQIFSWRIRCYEVLTNEFGANQNKHSFRSILLSRQGENGSVNGL